LARNALVQQGLLTTPNSQDLGQAPLKLRHARDDVMLAPTIFASIAINETGTTKRHSTKVLAQGRHVSFGTVVDVDVRKRRTRGGRRCNIESHVDDSKQRTQYGQCCMALSYYDNMMAEEQQALADALSIVSVDVDAHKLRTFWWQETLHQLVCVMTADDALVGGKCDIGSFYVTT
jgi:hypothetical protein